MSASLTQIILYALPGSVVGGLIMWSVQALISRRRIAQLAVEASRELSKATAERDALAIKNDKSRATIQQLRAVHTKRMSELQSATEKSKLLAKNVRTLLTERENTKVKVSTIQNALVSLRKKSTALQAEFRKAREFYKRELLKSLERRKGLEEDIKTARAEQEAFTKRVESSTLEHGSAEDMVIAAQLRLGQIEVLERNVNKLEAENAQLKDEILQTRQELAARERDLTQLEELKLHNKQLVRCVEALEGSRQAYEADAERFREQADLSEKESDTLRIKLEDLAKNFKDIEQQQLSALEDVRDATVVPILRKQS
ncbi:MAG: hypothetical protein WBN07_07065 [Woeseiaceae bacterium]